MLDIDDDEVFERVDARLVKAAVFVAGMAVGVLLTGIALAVFRG